MRRLPTVPRFVLMLFVALATLAAACGSDADPSDETTPVADGDDDIDTVDDEDVDTTDGDAETTVVDPDAAPAIELTASFRGVTADAIKVGVVAFDLEAVRAFVDLDHGSYEAAYAAVIAEVNRTGGVFGRDIEMIFDQYLPIGTEGMDTVCARFTQDEEVFAVLGALQDDGPLCYTALNETALIGSTQNGRRIEASTAPWFTGTRNSDDVVDVILRGFDREGVFDGATVAVVAAVADQREVEDIVIPLLAELAVEPVDVAYIESSVGDSVATDAEAQRIAERQKIEGADLIIAVGGGVGRYAAGLEDLDYRPRIAATSLSSLRGFIRDRSGRDFSVLDGSVAGNIAEQLGWWADPAIQDCIALVEASGEPEIFDPNTRPVDEPENLVSVAAACRDVALFVAIATAAGPGLTNASFAAAGAELGAFHIPGFGDGFYDAETPDGGAPVFFYEWDEELQDLRSDGTTL